VAFGRAFAAAVELQPRHTNTYPRRYKPKEVSDVEQYELNSSTSAWDFFVKLAFGIAVGATLTGIYMLPGELIVKGYFLISSLFLVYSTITMSKTIRDRHEADRLHNKISEARTSRIIREMDGE
jgi:hypothetical protein